MYHAMWAYSLEWTDRVNRGHKLDTRGTDGGGVNCLHRTDPIEHCASS